jgi:hypothetical protein
MAVISGHSGTDHRALDFRDDEQSITRAQLLLDGDRRLVVRCFVAKYVSPTRDHFRSVGSVGVTPDQCHIRTSGV